MAKGTVKLRGKEATLEGVLNIENMTIESEAYEEPISIVNILEKTGLDGIFVKVKFTESDIELTEEQLNA